MRRCIAFCVVIKALPVSRHDSGELEAAEILRQYAGCYNPSVATIQESLRRTKLRPAPSLADTVSRHDSGELEAEENPPRQWNRPQTVSRHDSGELEAESWIHSERIESRPSVATIQESLRRLKDESAFKAYYAVSRHDSGELEADKYVVAAALAANRQSPRFRRA